MKHYFFSAVLLLVSPTLTAEQNASTGYNGEKEASTQRQLIAQQSRPNAIDGLRATPSGDGRPVNTRPPCDEEFEKACKDAGGTLSEEQGWGGKTCFKSLEDDYCQNAPRRPRSLRGQ
jgi:hypothetical protein